MWNEGPMIWTSDILILLTSVGIIGVLTYFKKWKWLWDEWLTTVDHKKIGIMYLIAALLMLFRGGVDAIMMRTQLMLPNMHFRVVQYCCPTANRCTRCRLSISERH